MNIKSCDTLSDPLNCSVNISEGQRLPEFQVATPQLLGGVVPMPTNPQMAAAGFNPVPPIISEISPVVRRINLFFGLFDSLFLF
jgi:hypothetical protein